MILKITNISFRGCVFDEICHSAVSDGYVQLLSVLQDSLQLYHPISGMCLDVDAGSREIFVRACDLQADTQMWKFSKVNETAVRQLWKAT